MPISCKSFPDFQHINFKAGVAVANWVKAVAHPPAAYCAIVYIPATLCVHLHLEQQQWKGTKGCWLWVTKQHLPKVEVEVSKGPEAS